MAWIDVAKQDGGTVYWVFRGSFYDSAGVATTAAVWGTQYVKTSSGLIDGRLLSLGGISRSMPQTVGAMPESCSASITLDNSDRALTKYAIGTASNTASAEYGSDSFLNLRGSIYCGVKDSTGTLYEQRCSPTLFSAGPVQIGQSTITLSLAADDKAIFGDQVVTITARQLKENSAIASGEGVSWSGQQVNGGGTASAYSGTSASDHIAYLESNLDKVVPWVYGSTAIPLIAGTAAGGLLMPTYMIGVTKEEPTITGFASWQIFVGTHADPIRVFDYANDVIVYKTKRTVTYDDNGSTVDVWLLLLGMTPSDETTFDYGADTFTAKTADYSGTYSNRELYVVPHSSAKLGMQTGYTPSPAGLVRQLIKDHGGGAGVVEATSFVRANAALPDGDRFGGLIRTQAPIAGVCEYVCRPGALNLWIGKDDTLRMLPAAAWSAADVTAAATDLPHLRDVDILGSYSETVPRDPGDRGAAAKLVSVAWSDAQRKFWEAETLFPYAPGSTTLPIAGAAELELPGDWLYPRTAEQTLLGVGALYAFVTRRISFVTHLWVGVEYELGQLFRLTHPLAAGLGDGSGYTYRLARLEAVELIPGENACRVTFEDLGPSAATKVAVLDNIANWVRYDPTGSTDAIRLTAASTTVTAVVGTPFATAQVGDHLWTFGASAAANRRSRKITAVASSTQVSVEYAYSSNQSNFAASAGGTAAVDTNWLIVKTQGTKSPTNTTKLTACDEQSGNKFRDGTTAGFQCTGG